MYKFSDVPLARPNLHIPRLSRGSYRQGAADRGIFSFKKIREQRLWRLILSVLCLLVPFWAPKRKDRITALNVCKQKLRVKTTGEHKSKHHISYYGNGFLYQQNARRRFKLKRILYANTIKSRG